MTTEVKKTPFGWYPVERVRLYARRNPRRYVALSTAIRGLLVGALGGVPAFEYTGVFFPDYVLGIVFVGSIWAAIVAPSNLRDLRGMAPLPAGTDAVRLRAARRLVGRGALGSDPLTNAIALQLAKDVAPAEGRRAASIGFLAFGGVCVILMVQKIGDGSPAAATIYGSVGLLAVLVVVIDFLWGNHRRRNAAQLVQGLGSRQDPSVDGQ